MLFSSVAIAAFAGLVAAAPVKRGFGGRATFYATGLGACGQVSSDSDFIVALNTPQFGDGYPGPNCFKQIQISANGKTATATIMDQCPGCAYGALDLSPSLFNHFADPSVGVFQMSWDFVGAAAPAPEPTSTYVAPAPTSTYTPPAPTSTWVAPAPTSTWVAPTTQEKETPSSTWVAPSSSSVPVEVKVQSTSPAQPSSSSVWSESSSSSSAAAVSSTTASSSVESISTSATSTSSAPVPTITIDLGNGNLAELCEAVARMGKLVVVGASLANGTAVNIANTTLTLE
ncbi:hypothetical protein QFC21_004147 [Naganishia friedmannii]|uniref:Uncharacterized protein n=1 Tax=Naganishia friedmannii TaxID=89922 RepID=A0ACC2VKY6_9TREE|nr:hypothetical protein QFC21_004147 [Naganishia friedmannii]